jgi:protein dithiol oxidoreductase (disulfide-forming)
MTRLTLSSILAAALLVAGCGGTETPAPAGDATVPTPPAAVPADAGEPLRPETKVDEAEVTGAAADGETVEDARASVTPIAAAVAANVSRPAAPANFPWREGQHFSPLPAAQPVSVSPGQVEVTEIFWYGCGHCFTLSPRVKAWESNGRPDFVKVIRMPVVWNEVTREDARLFYTIEALGKFDTLHLAVFRELHVNRNPLTVVAGNRVDTAATEAKVREFMLKTASAPRTSARRTGASRSKARSGRQRTCHAATSPTTLPWWSCRANTPPTSAWPAASTSCCRSSPTLRYASAAAAEPLKAGPAPVVPPGRRALSFGDCAKSRYSMLNCFVPEPQGLTRLDPPPAVIPEHCLWVDLFEPTLEEEHAVEQFLAIEVPTREEMREIETSNRLYEEDGALYMTATVVTRIDTERPEAAAITSSWCATN